MEEIREIVERALPGREVRSVDDRGYWISEDRSKALYPDGWRGNRICIIELDDGYKHCLKLSHPDYTSGDGFVSELCGYSLLRGTDIPMPTLVTVDTSRTLSTSDYLVVSYLPGNRLSKVWPRATEEERDQIYYSIGKGFRAINGIKGERSGLFKTLDDPYETRYPISPNDYMFRAEIAGGSGARAVSEGVLKKTTHDRILQLWNANLEYLKDHTPSLVHVSSFSWTISLQHDDEWHISRLTGLGDLLWWDPGVNLALFRYPPFLGIRERHWDSFLKGYGAKVDTKRIALYGLLVKLQEITGVYSEPDDLRDQSQRNTFDSIIDRLIDESV